MWTKTKDPCQRRKVGKYELIIIVRLSLSQKKKNYTRMSMGLSAMAYGLGTPLSIFFDFHRLMLTQDPSASRDSRAVSPGILLLLPAAPFKL